MIDGLPIESSKTEVLPRTNIDHELKSNKHVNYLCKRHLLALVTFMNANKRRSIKKAFIESQNWYKDGP